VGFTEAKSDTSLFVYKRGSDVAYLLLYVDNIILTASSTELLGRIISAFQHEFSMKDLRTCTTSSVCRFSAVMMAYFFLSSSTWLTS